jgi:type IV pilus assembly protein PilQ
VSLRALRHCEAVKSAAAVLASFIGLLSACTPASAPNAPPSPAASARAPAASEPLPFPDTAFQGQPSQPLPSRFETRRIDPNDDENAHGTPSRFRGAPVDLDLKGADLADVFRLLADVGHVNIVVDGTVTGSITLRLKHVPWDQALDLVARTKGLALEREGNVIVVRVRS